MPKTFPIRLEVEEIALGTVLRKLNEMPGVVKLDLDLGHGGEGAGKKQLEQHAKTLNGGTTEEQAVKFLMTGPKHIGQISKVLGGSKSRAYGAMHQLRKRGLSESAPGAGMHQLTVKAMGQLGAVKALPSPAITHGPKGRATPGSGTIVLRSALDAGPVSPGALRDHMSSLGVSPKSLSGVLFRAKRDGLIKKNGEGYELTAKGQKIDMGASANG